MGWLVTFAIIFLLAIFPLGVSVRYDSDGLIARIIAGPIRIVVFPRPRKKKKTEVPEEKTKKNAAPKSQTQPQPSSEKKKSGGSVTDFLPLVKVGLDFLGDFKRKLRVNYLECRLILAGDDPCDVAVNYGRAWAAISNLMPMLERSLIIQKRDIEVECDFTADKMLITAGLDLTITLGRVFSLLTVYGIRGLKEFLSIRKKRKGGVDK